MDENDMRKVGKRVALIAAGAVLLQFGGCAADILADVFFAIGPLLL